MTQTTQPQCDLLPTTAHFSQFSQVHPQPDEVSELSAPISDVEPSTTATAARNLNKNGDQGKTKRSYKTVDPAKRRQLIQLVNQEQKTIKEAANRLKINYSTAKHIIKSKKTETPQKKSTPVSTNFELPLKQAASVDIQKLEHKIKALNESNPSLFRSSLRGEQPKTFNSSLLSTSLSLGQSLSLCPKISSPPSSLLPLNLGLKSCEPSSQQAVNKFVNPTHTSSLEPTQHLLLDQSKSHQKVTNYNPFQLQRTRCLFGQRSPKVCTHERKSNHISPLLQLIKPLPVPSNAC